MDTVTVCTAGNSAALAYARQRFKNAGCRLSELPGAEVTHLLLPVPSFEPDGSIKGGGDLSDLLSRLNKNVVILGGSLDRPELKEYACVDFLKDPTYIAQNAKITAHCALRLAMNNLPVTLDNQKALVIGWGRIGKCLAQLLKSIGAQVTVAARKENDRAMLKALGYGAMDTCNLDTTPYRLIFNTVPQMICPDCQGKGMKIDLASMLGLGGNDVLWARGLPSKDAPESSGQLIFQTAYHFIYEKE